eukprot:6501075-Pyramimonas_sp.AAC.2
MKAKSLVSLQLTCPHARPCYTYSLRTDDSRGGDVGVGETTSPLRIYRRLTLGALLLLLLTGEVILAPGPDDTEARAALGWEHLTRTHLPRLAGAGYIYRRGGDVGRDGVPVAPLRAPLPGALLLLLLGGSDVRGDGALKGAAAPPLQSGL